MTHYLMQDDKPTAIILTKNPKTNSLDELKSYRDNSIYLNKGDEFQIKLFNPLREKVGVQIGVNGDKSEGLLVLNPGEEMTLDRFIDDNSKMLFDTYTYNADNPSAQNAVALNGIIDIDFFREIKKRPRTINKSNTNSNSSGYYNTDGTYTTSDSVYLSSNILGIDTFTSPDVSVSEGDKSICARPNGYLDGVLQSFDSVNTNSRVYEESTYTSNFNNISPASFSDDTKSLNSQKETGRVERGDESNQNFTEVNYNFETFAFHNVTYNLKPISERKIISQEKIRNYCTSCSYRIRNDKWIYCPKCGNLLN